MHSGAVFSLRVVTYDRRRKEKCGRVIEYAAAVLVWGDGGKDRVKKQGEREMTEMERSMLSVPAYSDIQRDPSHAVHYTRNIRVVVDGLPTEAVHKIHPPLIIEFNGETTTP